MKTNKQKGQWEMHLCCSYTEAQLCSLIARSSHFNCTESFCFSRHAVNGGVVGCMADAAVASFDVAASDPFSYGANLLAGTAFPILEFEFLHF